MLSLPQSARCSGHGGLGRSKGDWIPAFAGIWRLDICEAAGSRFFIIEPQGGVRRVSVPIICSLSPNTSFVLGERVKVRGQHLADSRNSHFVPARLTMTTKRAACHSATSGPPLPTSPPESPKGGRFGGRGEEWVGTLTQGGASGSCPRWPWATFSRSYRAFKMKQRHPCRCTSQKTSNLHIFPLSRE